MPTLRDLENAVSGRLLSPYDRSTPLGRIVTDSRRVEQGDIFWAIRGERFDGADYIEQALRRGAAGCVASRFDESPRERWRLQVDDATVALGRWARFIRRSAGANVVAVTGSVGKTTTRRMIHTVLSMRFSGIESPGNFNNAIGVPLSLLPLHEGHDFAAIELGANRRGEIAELAAVAEPDLGVITAVADAHLGEFGGRLAVLEAKCELLDHVHADGGLMILADDPRLVQAARRLRARCVIVGESPPADLRAEAIVSRDGFLQFRVDGVDFRIPVWGRHHATAALCAIAVGREFGIPLSEAADALHAFRVSEMRCQVLDRHGITWIRDCYNACPTAVRAAIDVLGEVPCRGKRIAVLGDMLELGDQSDALHFDVGRCAGRMDDTFVLACGRFAGRVVDGARAAGASPERVAALPSTDEAIARLASTAAPGDVVLLKGSRAMRMERILEDFPCGV